MGADRLQALQIGCGWKVIATTSGKEVAGMEAEPPVRRRAVPGQV